MNVTTHRPSPPAVRVRFNFDSVEGTQLQQQDKLKPVLLQQPRIQVNCQQLACLHTHGVAHFVSFLLRMQSTGAEVELYNVSQQLYRIFCLLRLTSVFPLMNVV